jgi:hypothetical protein
MDMQSVKEKKLIMDIHLYILLIFVTVVVILI